MAERSREIAVLETYLHDVETEAEKLMERVSDLADPHDILAAFELMIGADEAYKRTRDGLIRALNREEMDEVEKVEKETYEKYWKAFEMLADLIADGIKSRARHVGG